jgi:iron complex transport system substrate-binding protein
MKVSFKKFFLFCVFLFSGQLALAKELRIVSLAPNLTEIVYALGKGENLQGSTAQCDYPAAAKKNFKVGDYVSPSLERIVQVKPDLVLATEGNPREILVKLKKLGMNVLETNPQSAAELPFEIEKIAKATNAEAQGKKLAQGIQEALASYKGIHKSAKRFVLVLQFDPLYSANAETWLGNLLALGGLKNIAAQTALKYPVLSREFLIQEKPDIAFVSFSEAKSNAELLAKENLAKVFSPGAPPAQTVLLPADILVRPGPRIVEGIAFLKSLKL